MDGGLKPEADAPFSEGFGLAGVRNLDFVPVGAWPFWGSVKGLGFSSVAVGLLLIASSTVKGSGLKAAKGNPDLKSLPDCEGRR